MLSSRRNQKDKSEEEKLAELPLEKLNEEYLKKATKAWDVTWDIFHRTDWNRCKGQGAKQNGIVYYQTWPDTGKVFKVEGELKGSVETCFNICVRDVCASHEWNPYTTEGNVIHVVNENTDISYHVTSEGAGGLIKKRDFVTVRYWKSADGYLVSAGIAVHHPKKPPTEKYVRGENKPGGWIFRPIPGELNKCTFVWIFHTLAKGWIPQSVVDVHVPGVILEYVELLRKRVDFLKANGTTS